MNWREYQALQQISNIGPRFISYVDQGTGEPLVLLHGIPTWGYVWHRLVPQLASEHRVLVPDLLGFGFSDKRDHFDRGIDRQAEAIVAWLDDIRVPRADVIGHDIGGGVALQLAVRFPERVNRLGLMNSICYDSWPIAAMLQLGHPKARRRLSAPAIERLVEIIIRRGFKSSPRDGLLEGLLAPYQTEVGKVSLIRDAIALDTNLTRELALRHRDIVAPTAIIWGMQDRFQPAKYARRLAFDIPRATLFPIEKARHFVMFDQPKRVLREISAFFGARRAEQAGIHESISQP